MKRTVRLLGLFCALSLSVSSYASECEVAIRGRSASFQQTPFLSTVESIQSSPRSRKKAKKKGRTQTGVVSRHPDGFGFLRLSNGEKDVFIPHRLMEGLVTGDRVRVKVQSGQRGPRASQIEAILDRRMEEVSGVVVLDRAQRPFLKDNGGWGSDIALGPEASRYEGQWVRVQVVEFSRSESEFHYGRVLESQGAPERAALEPQRFYEKHGITTEFRPRSLREAESLEQTISPAEVARRRDLREKVDFITIDGKTAKDFDDAIAVKKEAGGYRVWVAIADVSHYVRRGSSLDREAESRGNSTYLVGTVNPMLPFRLSEGLCSLNPHVDRLAMVAEMKFHRDGQIVEGETKLYEAVIQSRARWTYAEAQTVIEGKSLESEGLQETAPSVKQAFELTGKMRRHRLSQGGLVFASPEIRAQFNSQGDVVGFNKKESRESNQLIEELMLISNVEVARFIKERDGRGIFRQHEQPEPEKLAELNAYLVQNGLEPLTAGPGWSKEANLLLESLEGSELKNAISHRMVIAQQKAIYSPTESSHYGLGFADYSHFTSPIRRYADLEMHRAVKALLGIEGYQMRSIDELKKVSRKISDTEVRSKEAERDRHQVSMAAYYGQKKGEVFEAIVSGFKNDMTILSLKESQTRVMMRLKEDHVDFTEGMSLQVKIESADVSSGNIFVQTL